MQIDGRTCTQCQQWKEFSEFSWKGKDHKRLASRCHKCRRENYKENPARNRERSREYHEKNRDAILQKMKERRVNNPEVILVRSARKRAKEKGLSFDLHVEDVNIPATCPVLGIPLFVSDGKCGPNSPTLDRLDPRLGYVRGNVAVISHKANTIKNDATLEELEAVLAYVRAALGVAVTAQGVTA